jgi:hypothetical protein
MSDTPPGPTPPPLLPPRQPEQNNGCVTALMGIIGAILLLPGACSLILIFGGMVKTASDVSFAVTLGMLGCLGIAMIRWASRRGRP